MGAHVSVPMYRRTLPQRLRLEGWSCRACGKIDFPPAGVCSGCGSEEGEPVRLSGRGWIYALTFITVAGAPPEFAGQARRVGGYRVALVELDEGPVVTAQLVDGGGEPRIGDPVSAVFRRLYEEEAVLRYGFKFRLAPAPVTGGADDSISEATVDG